MNERFPEIVAEATSVGAKISFEDESGISLNIFSGRTVSLRGRTPVVYRSGQKTKRTMAAAISPAGDMYFETYLGGTTAGRYRLFLEHLNEVDENIKFIIHDGLPSHRAKVVKEYVKSTDGKLKLFQLPGYSPELNPDEWVWENLKGQLGRRAHKNLEDLTEHATKIMREIEANSKMIASFYDHVYC